MARYITLSNGIPHLAVDPGVSLYDQPFVLTSTITAGTAVTLPAGGTYTSTDLQITLNGQVLEDTFDYNWLGSPPRTQVSFTFDLIFVDSTNRDVIRFLKKS
jgi:hypothetical protein